ncbi:UNVERIFIED_ORG: ribulose-5-phosphate 4-epimerase/fuculose-1-phosphate aldolase [Pseudomonas reinekei]|nr:ribulose-5-phosphate 4-epimerase/fuculose-1-phosphate aldolase [Pseudomonas reinekei]
MSKPAHIDPIEWQARCELAALYRLVAHFRMTDLIDTHITLRIPGPEHHFLINRYGVIFDRMRASDLVRIDQEGRVVDPEYAGHRVNAAGFVIHSAIHMARPDLNCVIHTHTAAGMAVAAQKQGLLPISQHALKFYGKLAYHTYEGIALSLDERERLIADLGPHRAMILRNHGLLVGGGRGGPGVPGNPLSGARLSGPGAGAGRWFGIALPVAGSMCAHRRAV